MANSKISALTSATTPLAGTEVLPIVQSSTTKQVSVANLTAGRAVSAASLALTTTPLPVTSGGTGLTSIPDTRIVFGYTATAVSASSNFVYDYTNIRVGIGTSTPWSQASILTPSGGTVGYFGVKDSVYGGDVRFGKASGVNNNGVAGTWSNNDFQIYANSVNSFTFDTSSNLVPTTAAKGINFTANTGAAGKTSQLLNWYEEGTWTPSISNSFNNYTHTIQVGRYTRIGNLVTLEFTIAWTTTNAGALTFFIEGLPFTPVTLTNYASAGSLGVINNLTNTNQIVCQVESATSQIKFYARVSGGSATALASGNWNTAGTANQVSGTITYQV